MALSAQISVSVLVHESSSDSLSAALRVTPATYATTLSNGTGAGQAQIAYSETGTIPDGDDVSFSFGSLSDDRGSVTLTAIKTIYIKNTGTVELIVSGNAAWSTAPMGQVLVAAGGVLAMTNTSAAGWTSSQASAALAIANGEQTQGSYELVLIGEGTVL
jgi:hypothetical protein